MNSFSVLNSRDVLIVNADDFGYNASIDRGIVELVRKGVIRSLSVIVNGANILQAAELMCKFREEDRQAYSRCSIGLHLNLTEGPPLNDRLAGTLLAQDGSFNGKSGFYSIVDKLQGSILELIEEQVRLQIAQFVKLFRRRPSHLDGHNHVHLLPVLAGSIAGVMVQMGIYRVRGLNESLQRISIQMNEIFLRNYQRSKNYYAKHGIISCEGFVGLEDFGNLKASNIEESFLHQQQLQLKYRSVELMCHPGYTDYTGNAWVASADRQNELNQLQSQQFCELRKKRGLHSYLDLQAKSGQSKRVLIYSKLERGCGNQTTTLRLKTILQEIGYETYLWCVCDRIDMGTESEDLFRFLLNFGISLIIGVNATRSAEIVELATRRMRVPYILIIAGTDANLTFKDASAVARLQRALGGCECLISLSQDMKGITECTLKELGVKKQVYTIVQSSNLMKVIEGKEEPWVRPARPYILFTTSFRKVKCVDHLLVELNKMIDTYNFDVYIAGIVLDQSYFEQCVAKLGKVKYLGVLQKYVYARYLQNAFALINTSESEGMSCSILQAFELRIPVIVRRNSGNQELVSHLENGLLYESPQQFMGLFLMLRDNPDLVAKLTQKSYSLFQEKYNYQTEFDSYRNVIQKHFESRLFQCKIEGRSMKIFQKENVHPVSMPNVRLYEQIKHQFKAGDTVFDMGCGTGIFGLVVLSRAKVDRLKMYLSDISLDIVALAVYNYRQSFVWDCLNQVIAIASDMFKGVDSSIRFDVMLFNPPQSPFQDGSSRPDKNGGPDATKYIQAMLSQFKRYDSVVLYELYSFLAWPSRFAQLLKANKLKIAWKGSQQQHRILSSEYDQMEGGLSGYITEHWKKGRAEIRCQEGVFVVPAAIFRIERQ